MLIKLAFRNLWRHKRRTVITISSIAVGLLVAFLFTGFGDAGYTKLINSASRLGSGHLVFENPLFREDADLENSLKGADRIIKVIKDIPEVTGYSKRVSGQAIISTSHGSVGVGFDAVLPDLDREISLLAENISKGIYLNENEINGIIIGEKTAKKLKVDIGQKVVITAQNKNNRTVQQLAKVSGIFSTGSDFMDGFYFQMNLRQAREMLGLEENEVSQLGVYLSTYLDIDKVKKNIKASRILEEEPVVLLEWSDILQDLANYITVDYASNYIYQIIIFLVIGAGVLNTILMSVMERTHEFGILISLGMDTKKILSLVLIESFFIGILGIITGSVAGGLAVEYFKKNPLDLTELYGESITVSGFLFDPYMSADLYFSHYIVIIGMVFMLVMLAGIYPAFKASRIKPVEALHLLT